MDRHRWWPLGADRSSDCVHAAHAVHRRRPRQVVCERELGAEDAVLHLAVDRRVASAWSRTAARAFVKPCATRRVAPTNTGVAATRVVASASPRPPASAAGISARLASRTRRRARRSRPRAARPARRPSRPAPPRPTTDARRTRRPGRSARAPRPRPSPTGTCCTRRGGKTCGNGSPLMPRRGKRDAAVRKSGSLRRRGARKRVAPRCGKRVASTPRCEKTGRAAVRKGVASTPRCEKGSRRRRGYDFRAGRDASAGASSPSCA